jgi:intracellular septation protein A
MSATPRRRVSVGALLLGSGPRFARDAVGPVLAFYVCWKLVGLGTAIAVATTLSAVAYGWERRQGRPGIGAALGFAITLTQAVVGLTTNSAIAYFVPPLVVNGLWGLAFLGSAAIGRPLSGVFAQETYPFPEAVKASRTYRRVFSAISVVWGVYFLARTGIRLVVLSQRNVDLFIVINIATGIPFTAALMSWSIWYGVRGFRRSAEWGPALQDERG